MSRRIQADPLRAIQTLEARVKHARAVLQRTTEAHPAFEERVEALVRLIDQRDRAMRGSQSWLEALLSRQPQPRNAARPVRPVLQ